MDGPFCRLRLGAVMMSVTLLWACGSPDSAVRAEGRARSTTTGMASTTVAGSPPDSRPAPTTTARVPHPTTTVRIPPSPSTTTARITVVTTSTTTPAGGSGVNGVVLFSPICPVERIPPDPQCAPRPGAADVQLVGLDGGVAAQGRAGSDGRFSIVVAPGRYTVAATAPSPGLGRFCQADPDQVSVGAGTFVSVAVACDTGIR